MSCKKDKIGLAPETIVEVIKIDRKTGISKAKKIMTLKESLAIKNNKGFYYRIYQIGFSSFG